MRKRILSLTVALAMVLALAPAAFQPAGVAAANDPVTVVGGYIANINDLNSDYLEVIDTDNWVFTGVPDGALRIYATGTGYSVSETRDALTVTYGSNKGHGGAYLTFPVNFSGAATITSYSQLAFDIEVASETSFNGKKVGLIGNINDGDPYWPANFWGGDYNIETEQSTWTSLMTGTSTSMNLGGASGGKSSHVLSFTSASATSIRQYDNGDVWLGLLLNLENNLGDGTAGSTQYTITNLRLTDGSTTVLPIDLSTVAGASGTTGGEGNGPWSSELSFSATAAGWQNVLVFGATDGDIEFYVKDGTGDVTHVEISEDSYKVGAAAEPAGASYSGGAFNLEELPDKVNVTLNYGKEAFTGDALTSAKEVWLATVSSLPVATITGFVDGENAVKLASPSSVEVTGNTASISSLAIEDAIDSTFTSLRTGGNLYIFVVFDNDDCAVVTLPIVADSEMAELLGDYNQLLEDIGDLDETDYDPGKWAAFQSAIADYLEGEVDETDKDELRDAIAALEAAIVELKKTVVVGGPVQFFKGTEAGTGTSFSGDISCDVNGFIYVDIDYDKAPAGATAASIWILEDGATTTTSLPFCDEDTGSLIGIVPEYFKVTGSTATSIKIYVQLTDGDGNPVGEPVISGAITLTGTLLDTTDKDAVWKAYQAEVDKIKTNAIDYTEASWASYTSAIANYKDLDETASIDALLEATGKLADAHALLVEVPPMDIKAELEGIRDFIGGLASMTSIFDEDTIASLTGLFVELNEIIDALDEMAPSAARAALTKAVGQLASILGVGGSTSESEADPGNVYKLDISKTPVSVVPGTGLMFNMQVFNQTTSFDGGKGCDAVIAVVINTTAGQITMQGIIKSDGTVSMGLPANTTGVSVYLFEDLPQMLGGTIATGQNVGYMLNQDPTT